jgi:predicted permease
LVTALNVGNLLLGRAIERRGELAVRAAVGAGRARIVRQLAVEAFVLTGLGLAGALYLAELGGPWLAQLFVGEAVVTSSSAFSGPVLTFGALAALGAGLVLAGVPVAHHLRARSGPLTLRLGSGMAAQRVLVAVQAALATVLLVSATLLVATVGNLRRVPLGFDPDRLLAVQLSPPEDRLADTTVVRGLYDGLVERVAAIPGVRSAGLTASIPLATRTQWAPINHEWAPVDQVRAERAVMNRVDPGFFSAMEMSLVEGRLLDSRERAVGPSAVVVNRTMAEEMWPGRSPIGERIAIDPHQWSTFLPVVGVVEDLRSVELTGASEPALYVSLAEAPFRDVSLVVRTAGLDPRLVPAVRRAVSDVDPTVAVRSTTWMSDVVRAAYSLAWVIMGLLVALAVLATALGATGVYAALSQHVSASRREIGVRMALGAHPTSVVRGVVRSGLLVTAAGIAVGSVLAAVAARALDSLLFGVSTLAPWAYVAPAVALGVAAVLAGWLPAARAGRLPPAEVLRGD